MKKITLLLLFSGLLFSSCSNRMRTASSSAPPENIAPKRVEVLFLGHNSQHHDSEKYTPILATALFKSGINITYTNDLSDLNTENLNKYDALLIYANHDTISASQEQALKEFVEGGKGLVPIHCASWCFRNSDWYVKAVGGQFKSHKTGTFTAKVTNASHPVMAGITEFETWDETYVHSNINPDITVLMEREENGVREPWTWVRTQGKGRVFYTAYGHDERTWSNPGFLKLVQNGILWSINDEARAALAKFEIPEAVYSDANIPNYEKRDPAPQYQHPFTAEQSQKLIQVPVDFEIELFASEPDIVKPIAMAWDEKGRLWVIETVDYPNEVRQQDGVGSDRIKICEDTDGDGRADKFTVFAENLNIPTSMVFANGGVIVAQAPHFIFLKDTNGDDKADIRENIITGWGKSDTHAGPSNLRYGLDNRIWGVLGYSGFDGEVGGKHFKFSQGVYNFSPDGKDLEYLARTSNNTWGLGFSEENDVFISTANNTHSAFYAMPDRFTRKRLKDSEVRAVKKIDGHYDMHVVFPNLRQVDVHGGFTAAAGHSLYTARNFPENYWNKIAFVCEPTGRVIHQAILERDGSGFKEKDGWNLLASADEWLGPVQAEVGPDGAVWVADWYNFIIQHNPTPRGFENGPGNAYVNPLRDRERGRVYRIKYKNAKPYEPIQLSKENTEGLLAALRNDNMFWRSTAQRLIVESKNRSVVPGLYQIINDQSVDKIGLNSPAVHALWTLHGLGVLDGSNAEAVQVVKKALRHPAAAVRKAAIQVLPQKEAAAAIKEAALLKDSDLRVRLASLLIIADLPSSEDLGRLVYDAALDSENTKDEFISQALYAGAIAHQQGFQAQAAAGHTGGTHRMSALTQAISAALAEEAAANKAEEEAKAAAAKKNAPAKPAVKPAQTAAKPQVVNLKVVEHVLKFDKETFTVKAGQRVIINLKNPDFMQHNMLILKPGTLEKVGAAADLMARDPKGAEKNYVPRMPEVLYATKLINPEESATLQFTAPSQPGNYPFVCTFPGHWRIMNGIMKVVK